MAKGRVDIKINVDDKASGKMKTIGINADKMAKGFAIAGAGMMAVGVGIIAGLGKLVNNYSQAGDEVAKMAKRTGISTEALSEMRHVAELTGTSLASYEKSMKKLSKVLVDADAGMEAYVRAFDRIGLSVEDLMAMKPEDQFWAIASAIGAVEDPTLKAAAAQEIFGKSGVDLIPMMGETEEAIASMKQEAHDLNLVFDEEAAAAAESFEDSKTRLTGSLTGIGNAIAESVMPQFEGFIQLLTEKMQPAMSWLKDHPEIVQSFLKFGAIFTVTGALFLGIAAFIKLIQLSLIPTLIRAMIAFIGYYSLLGPAGWAVIAGAVAVAAGAIFGLNKLMGGLFDTAEAFPEPIGEAPPTGVSPPTIEAARAMGLDFKHGGIVPGDIGQPVSIIAHGGEQFAGVGNTLGTTINIKVAGSLWQTADLVNMLRREFILLKDRNVTTGF